MLGHEITNRRFQLLEHLMSELGEKVDVLQETALNQME